MAKFFRGIHYVTAVICGSTMLILFRGHNWDMGFRRLIAWYLISMIFLLLGEVLDGVKDGASNKAGACPHSGAPNLRPQTDESGDATPASSEGRR